MRPQRVTLDGAHSRYGHGTRACYLAGCREAVCIAANRAYQRDYRDGLRGTYTNRKPGPYRITDSPYGQD